MSRPVTSCPTGSLWDMLCCRCQCMVKAHGFEEEIKHGPRFQAHVNAEQQEKKLKELAKRLEKTEEEKRILLKQIEFLQSWDPFVMSPTCTDIQLQSAGHVVHAHKAVLAGKSDVFGKRLRFSVAQMNEAKTGIIEVNVLPDVLEAFIRYFYIGVVSPSVLKTHALGLLSAADKYNVQSLSLLCQHFIAQNLTIETALSTWEIGHDYSSEIIKGAVINALSKDIRDIPNLTEYKNFRAIKDPELLVDLFESIVRRA
ncbi:hypothetical protein R1flu_008786 [Riccia fluitans]|uniref:BTB domain-containing protein n=1 Tax=Riccia fluitans TaxID=41844 RepID=A0ABD1XEJ0_9MARC